MLFLVIQLYKLNQVPPKFQLVAYSPKMTRGCML